MFTLVLKGTAEEKWFENSTSGRSYIEIDELELNDILNYTPLNIPEKEAKDVDLLFRL